ncbi:MAG: hypothetical protein C0631_12895 [Sedimenticola sp.]|nr:MAG: hypothetical protein C0631_12895 [Sedimenticola sp.]
MSKKTFNNHYQKNALGQRATEQLLSGLTCSCCERAIAVGQTVLELSRNVECLSDCDGIAEVRVVESETIASFCSNCFEKLPSPSHWRAGLLRLLGLPSDGLLNNTISYCDCCLYSTQMIASNITINLTISEVEEHPLSEDGIGLDPFFAQGILEFCPLCSTRFPADCFRSLITDLFESVSAQ